MTGLVLCVTSIVCVSEACRGQPSRAWANPAKAEVGRAPAFVARLPASARRRLDAADVGNDQLRAAELWLVLALGSSLIMHLVWGPLVSVGSLITLVVGFAVTLIRVRDRKAIRVVEGLPMALDSIARSMRAGLSLRHAIGEAVEETNGPLSAEFGRVVRAAERGRPLDEAILSLAERFPQSEMRIATVALSLGATNEAGTARALDGVATSLRDAAALRAEVKALISQAEASMFVTAGLPIVFLGFTSLVDRGAASYLVTEPFGRVCLVAGLTLDLLGFVWMRRLVRRLR